MERIRTALSFGGILPEERLDYLLTFLEERQLKPGEEFLPIGNVSNEIGFIDEGILRCYGIGKQGEEVTKYFIRQNQFAVNLESYYDAIPSESALQAVVPTKIYSVKRTVWNRLAEEVPKLYILTKTLTEATLLNKIKDNDFLNFGTAKDKYQEFLNRYPDLALQVPLAYIASYLKITPQSLSRIRKQVTEEKAS